MHLCLLCLSYHGIYIYIYIYIFIPQVPQKVKSDYRATCFCHQRVVDVGYVCPVCLAIFCQLKDLEKPGWKVQCDICHTRFGAKLQPRQIELQYDAVEVQPSEMPKQPDRTASSSSSSSSSAAQVVRKPVRKSAPSMPSSSSSRVQGTPSKVAKTYPNQAASSKR